MAVYTLLDAASISTLLERYAIGSLAHFEPISSGIENTNYFVWTIKQGAEKQSAWVLTIFENLPEAELPFFTQLTAYLQAQGFFVPAPVLQKDGGDYFHLSIASLTATNQEQFKCGVIVPCLSGEALHAPDMSACHQVADYLARMHLALENFPLTKPVDHGSRWFERRVQQLLSHVQSEDAVLLGEAWARYEGYISDLNACTIGIVHGDLFRDNVLFEQGIISGVIDFYHAGKSPLLFDLAVLANDWAFVEEQAVYDEVKLDVLVQTYAAVRPLSKAELVQWPRFLELAAFRFWLSRLKTLYQPGYQQQIKQGNSIKSPDAMKRILLAAMQR